DVLRRQHGQEVFPAARRVAHGPHRGQGRGISHWPNGVLHGAITQKAASASCVAAGAPTQWAKPPAGPLSWPGTPTGRDDMAKANPLQEQLLKAGLVKKSKVAEVAREQPGRKS